MTKKKELLDAYKQYSDEVSPALEEMTAETMRNDGPINALAWVGTVLVSFLLCLGLLLLVTGG